MKFLITPRRVLFICFMLYYKYCFFGAVLLHNQFFLLISMISWKNRVYVQSKWFMFTGRKFSKDNKRYNWLGLHILKQFFTDIHQWESVYKVVGRPTIDRPQSTFLSQDPTEAFSQVPEITKFGDTDKVWRFITLHSRKSERPFERKPFRKAERSDLTARLELSFFIDSVSKPKFHGRMPPNGPAWIEGPFDRSNWFRLL